MYQCNKILKIYEIYHYPHTSEYDPETGKGGLFTDQVNLFIKIKTEASGYPGWVETDRDKDKYIQGYKEKMGVTLDKDKINFNPALRSIAKIFLNSFWGKLGEKNNKTKTKFISDTTALTKIQNNSKFSILNFHVVNEDMMVVEYNCEKTFEEDSYTTNEIIASLTTCYGRLELLKYIDIVGRQILYCDTDSLIFVTEPYLDKNDEKRYTNYPPLGDCLGDLTNELAAGIHISEFVCAAPKSYSYRTSDHKETVKFKGVILNSLNTQRINFQSVKELVFDFNSSVSLVPQIQFTRSKFEGIIFNTPLIKKLRCTFDKRRILPSLDTIPYGYIEKL